MSPASEEARERTLRGRALFGKPLTNLPPPHLLGVDDEGGERWGEEPCSFIAKPRRKRPAAAAGEKPA
jgi:hypothetical protein